MKEKPYQEIAAIQFNIAMGDRTLKPLPCARCKGCGKEEITHRVCRMCDGRKYLIP